MLLSIQEYKWIPVNLMLGAGGNTWERHVTCTELLATQEYTCKWVLTNSILRVGWGMGGNTVLYSWARQATCTVLLATQEYKWVLTNSILGVGWGMGGNTVLYSWARHVTCTVLIATQEYKWVLTN